MNELLERIDRKLDKVQEDLNEIKLDHVIQNNNIERNTKDLADHIEGVKQNRGRVECLEKDNVRIKMIWKVILGIGTLVGIAVGISRL